MQLHIHKSGKYDKIQDENNGINFKLKKQVKRAKLVHRKTLALYDKHLNAFYGCMESHLFDRALIINLIKRYSFEKSVILTVKCIGVMNLVLIL